MTEEMLQANQQRILKLILPPPIYTGPQTAERAGVEFETARKIWRALGMADVPDDVVAFSDEDVEALGIAKTVLDVGFPLEGLISRSRVLGQAMSRVADSQSRMVRDQFIGPLIEGSAVLPEQAEPMLQMLLAGSARLLQFVYRRHLGVALQHLSEPSQQEVSELLAAAFVDLVGFSRISEDLEEADLGKLVDIFEGLVIEVCADRGVRLVKIVGDAVLFVSRDPGRVLQTCMEILEKVEDSATLPSARAGIDFGPILPMGGDYFGRPVNVAARIAAYARPGTLLVSRALVDEIVDTDVQLTRLTPRRLKNVGRVGLFRVHLASSS